MEKQEIWKSIPGFDGYEVSDKGQVRSYFARTEQYTWSIVNIPQRTLKPSKSSSRGYLGVNLRKDGITYRRKIHRLVLLAFIGPCPDGLTACHNNDIANDNQLENLRYDTRKENMHDMVRNNGCSLSVQDVKDIRHRRTLLESPAQIAKDYDVSFCVVASASTGASYKCIDAEAAPVNDYRKKLIPDQVIVIKWLLLNKAILRKEIAKHFGVHKSMITRIANGTRWAHISSAVPM